MSQVEVTFLGSGDAFGSGGRFQTCFHVRSATMRFLIDCGPSALIAMKRFGQEASLVDLVLLSHLHGDHFAGLPFLILEAQFSRRTRPLVVAGPPGVGERVRGTMELMFPGSSQVQRRFAVEFIELTERSQNSIGELIVIPYGVVHPSGAPSYALRVEFAGRTIGYSGDTEWTDALLAAARGADLFICEAYFFDRKIKYHLDYRTLQHHRPQLDCRRLILTHMGEDMLPRLPELGVEWAEDGQSVIL